MNDSQLKRNLISVGKECFVDYFEQFNDLRLSNREMAEQIQEDRSHYSWKSCLSRAGHARSIIRHERARDALENIRDSEGVRDQCTRDRAAFLAASLWPDMDTRILSSA